MKLPALYRRTGRREEFVGTTTRLKTVVNVRIRATPEARTAPVPDACLHVPAVRAGSLRTARGPGHSG